MNRDRTIQLLSWGVISALVLFGPTIILSLWPIKTVATKGSLIQVGEVQSIFSRKGYQIPESSSINPELNQNFYLLMWFNPKELPREGMRLPILSKINSDRRALPGFAIALKRNSDEIRPEVYWRNDEGRGRWFTFAPFPVSPQRWHMLLLSFRENRFLGLHSVTTSPDGNGTMQLLGGYNFEPPELIAASSAPIRVGSFSSDGFIGEIGPIGIIAGGSSRLDLLDIVEEASLYPSKPPALFKTSAIKLWIGDKISSQYLVDPKAQSEREPKQKSKK